jgi:hypothetical protein
MYQCSGQDQWKQDGHPHALSLHPDLARGDEAVRRTLTK